MNQEFPTIGIYAVQDIANNGFPVISHSHSLVVFHKGKIIRYLELERHSRKKYDNGLYTYLPQILKQDLSLDMNQCDFIFCDNIIDRNLISSDGSFRFHAPISKTLKNTIEIGDFYRIGAKRKAYILNHELAHLYSCLPFYGDFKNNSLLIHFDGGASQSNFSAWQFSSNKLNLIESHYDLKYLSSFFNANALSFAIVNETIKTQNAVPGKLMGLAAFGEYSVAMEIWLKENMYFQNIWNNKKIFFRKLKDKWGVELTDFDTKNKIIQDIAATFQYVFVRDTFSRIAQLKDKTKAQHLYFSGGSALNIDLNMRLIESGSFENVFVPPCPSDAGLSIGAAACLEKLKGNLVDIHQPYLNNWFISNYENDYSEKDIHEICQLLLENKIIGICNGHAEAGPRALGNRSIICLANSKRLAHKLSVTHKGREWYRPVAPVMLEKNCISFTQIKVVPEIAKYMLLSFRISNKKRKEIIGAVHADGSARIQSVNCKVDNPYLFDLLLHLDTEHNIKALLNTSFNKKGEPIVHSKEDALYTAKKMKLDALVVNGKIVWKRNS